MSSSISKEIETQNLKKGMELAKKHFDDLLVPLGLTEQQLQSQNLDELRKSLESVNDAITHPESFGTIKLKLKASVGMIITSIGSEANFEIGILPILLERKKLIIERIGILEGNQKINDIKDLIENQVSDEAIKVRLQEELKNLSSGSLLLQKELKELEKQQMQEKNDAQERFLRLQIELSERKAKIWQSFLERESVATFVGAFLLLIIVLFFIIGMFKNVPSTDILNNVLLVILGYFFGQAAGKATSLQGSEK